MACLDINLTAAMLAAMLAAAPIAQDAPAPEPLRVMTFNIRYGTAPDGANHWTERRDSVVETIRRYRPHVLGVQEALSFQLEFLARELPGFEQLGQGRDGGRKGEFSALLIDRERLGIERRADFWLSETPHLAGSKSWDSSLPRMCTWAVLHDRTCSARLAVLNTHFDHRGAEARARGAALIVETLREFSGLPVVMTGDLNAGEGSRPLETLARGGLRDSFRVTHPAAEDVGTFNAWRGRTAGAKIDYVLVGDGWRVLDAAIHREAIDGRFPSDHFPVSATLAPERTSAPRLMPVVDGDWWHITNRADLGALTTDRQEAVDHAIFRSDDGKWHCWSCIRGTSVGRVLHAWEGDSLEQHSWRPRGIVMRADPDAGESIDDWNGQEWIQAPHVIVRDGIHHMFYGGHRSELGPCQINLATSPDGRTFTRRRDDRGFSRVFVGPGEARDPMVLEIDGRYHCYYTGHDEGARAPCKVYCRISENLLRWSEPVAVAWGGSAGSGNWSAECPFVVARDGYFYLFRTTSYGAPLTDVYRSTDPLDFGRDDDVRRIGTIAVAAPEIVELDGRSYISSVHDLRGGIQLARLRWIDEDAAPTSLRFRARMQERSSGRAVR